MRQTKLQDAFTLIELLLVIAVLSIIAALGIMSYRRYFQTNRIDKVAISMQHVLEAAMSFYVDNSATWPLPKQCDDSTPTTNSFVTDYLPNGSYQSTFGTDFCWHDAGAGSAPQQHRLFWVAVRVPGAAPDSTNIAKRLAARLPNAVVTSQPNTPNTDPVPPCDSDGCYVRTEITVPGTGTGTAGSLSLAAAGTCSSASSTPIPGAEGSCRYGSTDDTVNDGFTVLFPACPAGTHPDLNINPNFIRLPTSDSGYTMLGMQAHTGACSQSADSSGNENCSATVNVTVCTPHRRQDCNEVDVMSIGNGAQIGASYVVSCVMN